MKKLLIIALFAIFASCSPKPKAIIAVELQNIEDQTAYLMQLLGADDKETITDSVKVVDGKFTFILDDTTPRRAAIKFSKGRAYFNIIVEEGTLSIIGDYKRNTAAKISGTFITDKNNELRVRERPLNIKRTENSVLYRKIMAECKDEGLSQAETEEKLVEVRAAFVSIAQELEQVRAEMIEENKDNIFSVYQNTMSTPTTVRGTQELIDKIPTNLRKNDFYNYLERRLVALANVDEGAMAPDFTSTTVDGEKFTLSSTRGKVVLLDTWGST